MTKHRFQGIIYIIKFNCDNSKNVFAKFQIRDRGRWRQGTVETGDGDRGWRQGVETGGGDRGRWFVLEKRPVLS